MRLNRKREICAAHPKFCERFEAAETVIEQMVLGSELYYKRRDSPLEVYYDIDDPFLKRLKHETKRLTITEGGDVAVSMCDEIMNRLEAEYIPDLDEEILEDSLTELKVK